MLEKIEGETEVSCYSGKTYFYSGASVLGGVLSIILCITTKIIFNTFGNRIDFSKLFALLLVILCIEGYLQRKILDKKNKITKLIKTHEYIDPRKDYVLQASQTDRKARSSDIVDAITPLYKSQVNTKRKIFSIDGEAVEKDNSYKEIKNKEINNKEINNKEINIENSCKKNSYKETVDEVWNADENLVEDVDEDVEPTLLLNAVIGKTVRTPVLKADDEAKHKNIPITDFPFFIGKLKKNVDYCLENDMISRYHAKVTKEGETYYLTDLNSTNGTFINQELLQTYQKKEIRFEDEIVFANIKYKFMQE